jgi:hypothetical protein
MKRLDYQRILTELICYMLLHLVLLFSKIKYATQPLIANLVFSQTLAKLLLILQPELCSVNI